jgi:hypothetical protein
MIIEFYLSLGRFSGDKSKPLVILSFMSNAWSCPDFKYLDYGWRKPKEGSLEPRDLIWLKILYVLRIFIYV